MERFNDTNKNERTRNRIKGKQQWAGPERGCTLRSNGAKIETEVKKDTEHVK